MYVLSVNPIIDILSSKYDIVSYADDILLGVDDDVNIDSVIEEIQDLFSCIGLTINREKCHCTRSEDVKFMGALSG